MKSETWNCVASRYWRIGLTCCRKGVSSASVGSSPRMISLAAGRPVRLALISGSRLRKKLRTKTILALRHTTRSSLAGIVLDQELARALGRVLAHEIGHVLLGAPYTTERA